MLLKSCTGNRLSPIVVTDTESTGLYFAQTAATAKPLPLIALLSLYTKPLLSFSTSFADDV